MIPLPHNYSYFYATVVNNEEKSAQNLLMKLSRVPPAGFEPAAHCLEGSCSIQLSYGGE